MSRFCLILLFICLILLRYCEAVDKITVSQFLKDPETLVSSNGAFKLGFFTPLNSTYRYVGIWYSNDPKDVVWVANRDTPIPKNDTSGLVRISEDGNLQVLNAANQTFWSSNLDQSSRSSSSEVAQLQDSGNLVLMGLNGGMKNILWQSFQHPTDTVLANMNLTVTKESGITKMLQSWTGPSDPSNGRFSLGIDSFNFPQLVVWDGNQTHWRSGPWNGNSFNGIIQLSKGSDSIDAQFNIENVRQDTVYLTYPYTKKSSLSNYALDYDGTLIQKWWDESKREWNVVWKSPKSECDVYTKCGEFGSCNPLNSPVCQCLKGFEPKNKLEWNKGNWQDGCVRRTPLECGSPNGKQDGFFRIKAVKVPDKATWLSTLQGLDKDECITHCLNLCLCLAYAYDPGAGCMSWGGDLIDIEVLSEGGIDLYVRLAQSELGNNSKVVVYITVAAGVGAASFLTLAILLWMWRRRTRQRKRLQRQPEVPDPSGWDENEFQLEEVPFFQLKELEIATNNFQEINKLGRGGFGPVYQGRMQDEREIAVKRLSAASGQGLNEFINEVSVISKLQHRNLVRLLGYYADKEEKMLVYEYLPNKSLDLLLFDPAKRERLPWKTRYDIIRGICSGLLYLHRDSRLRIIHRDLKASNILLDEKLNPKISDFGMAKIFEGKQDQDDTRKIVGTYGYMSPEYAMGGRFSEKSDVFSFGVLLLEIVSGKLNSLFWYEDNNLSLLGYAYKLLEENDVISFIDPVIAEASTLREIQKCMQVGLLCVQESAADRPSIATVLSMFHSDIADIPLPKQPGFAHCQRSCHAGTSSEEGRRSSVFDVSVTVLSAR